MSQSPYQAWGTPFNPVYATPCDRCRLTSCHSIHGHHALPNCTHQSCQVCTDFAALDKQIAAAQNQLMDLVHKRWLMKSRFNDHHEQLTRRLPLEIVSDIFLFVTASADPSPDDMWYSGSFKWDTLFLGSICKKWRDITLGLPKLWCTLNIKPWNPKFSLNSAKVLLHRSAQLPLSLIYKCENIPSPWGSPRPLSYRKEPHLLKLLRSQATRWKDFTFKGSWKTLHDLLHKIDDFPSINTLHIEVYHGIGSMEPIQTRDPIRPKEFISEAVPISKISIQWDNLTYLDAYSIHFDELLHIIHHGTNLTSCTVRCLLEHNTDTHYALPTRPIVHHAMMHLCLDLPAMEYSDIVRYLTLPRLETFSYQSRYFDTFSLDTLVDFLDRSRPPLHTFTFEVDLSDIPVPWYERLPSVTHVKIGTYPHYGDPPSSATEQFLRALTNDLNLPHLQVLRINTEVMPWPSFCKIFQTTDRKYTTPTAVTDGPADIAEVAGSVAHLQPVSKRHKRPLDFVEVVLNNGPQGTQWEEMTNEDVFSDIMNIRASGVRLIITDTYSGTDLIERANKIITSRELPFASQRRQWNTLPGNGWESD